MSDELDDDFGVGGGLKVSSSALQLGPQRAKVYQVAVVLNGDQSLGGIDADRLRIEQSGVAGGRVARVADAQLARQLAQHVFGKDLRDQAHAFDVRKMMPIGRGNAGRFLPAMLQSIKPKIDLPRRVRVAVNSHDAALFAELGGVVLRGKFPRSRSFALLRMTIDGAKGFG